MYHIWLIHLLAVGHVDNFRFLPIMNKCCCELLYVSFCVNMFSVFLGPRSGSFCLQGSNTIFDNPVESWVFSFRYFVPLYHMATEDLDIKKFIQHLLNTYVLVSVLAI